MADSLVAKFHHSMLVLLIVVVVLSDRCTSGARCRFASTSASRGSCIFPCRCTNGCNTTTGECIKGGSCKDGLPSGYHWHGPACQIGNIAYKKKATQNGGYREKFPAVAALDGNTDGKMTNKHCAHPSGNPAWWTVDLAVTHRIYYVVIHNRGDCCERRLDTFNLSVGYNSNINSQTVCARHNCYRKSCIVPKSGSLNTTCNAITRYLSFRRDGGYEPYSAGLCEVVVIGHRNISCQYCPSTSACNDVIGCDACAQGKQQPDCKKPCDKGNYGVNCLENCGQCKGNSACVVTNGHCTNGCKDWYISDVCKTYIPVPHFRSPQKPQVDVITSSSAVVSWPKANDIPPGLEAHYYYVVWLQVDGETERKVAQIVQDANNSRSESYITGLVFNTRHSIRVEPYRKYENKRQGGTSTDITSFKTSCIAPTIPTITNVTESTSNGTINASMVVEWKKINDSGCDELVAVGVAYRTLTSPTDDWLYKEAVRVNQTQLSIEFLSYEVYDVNVTVTNNENISSTSETFTVSLTTTTSTTTTTTTTSIPTTTTAAGVTAAEVMSDSGPGTGTIAGVSVAVIIVIAGVSAVIVVVVLRRRREEQQKTTDDIAVAFRKPTKQGSGKENVAFDDGKEAEEEDGNHNLDQAIYANTQQVTHGVTTGALAAYVEDKRRHNGFEKEFADLPSGIRAKCEAARVPDNKPKNRFVNIVAYDHTRVVLSAESGESDYINASHIMVN